MHAYSCALDHCPHIPSAEQKWILRKRSWVHTSSGIECIVKESLSSLQKVDMVATKVPRKLYAVQSSFEHLSWRFLLRCALCLSNFTFTIASLLGYLACGGTLRSLNVCNNLQTKQKGSWAKHVPFETGPWLQFPLDRLHKPQLQCI